MHSEILSPDNMAVLVSCRATIENAMAQYLADSRQGYAAEDEKAASHQLFEALLGGLSGEAEALQLDDWAVRRHASRFGDGLTPILKDVLGPEVSDIFVARCVDRYWATLQAAAA